MIGDTILVTKVVLARVIRGGAVAYQIVRIVDCHHYITQ